MTDLTLRLVKGSPLTNQEVDDNFSALNTDKLEASDLVAASTSYDNSSSGLFAGTVQAALDELNVKKVDVGDVRVGVSLFPTTVDVAGEYLMASATTDTIYDETAANIPTGVVANETIIATTVSEAGLITGDIENVNVHLVGNIRKTAGNENDYASFYFKVYLRDDSLGADVLIATSGPTQPVNATTYVEYVADALVPSATFAAEDKIVLEFIATSVAGGPEYDFQFGGATPVRFSMPVALANVNQLTEADQVLVDTASFANVLGVADSNVQLALQTIDAAIPAVVSDLTNDAGYITSEADPVFTASEAFDITATDKANWTTAYTWGNHADQGYLTSYTETDPVFTLSEAFNVGTGDVDFGANRILFANVYNQLADLPSASSYHGMFAHVHSTGRAYFAHAGNWIELKDEFSAVTESDVTQHQAALQLTESQITDLQAYITEAPVDGNQYARKDSTWEQVIPPVTTESDPVAKSDSEYLRQFTSSASAYLGRQGGEYKMTTSPGFYDAETVSATYPGGVQYGAGLYVSPASPFTVMGGTWFSYPVHIQFYNNHSGSFKFRVRVEHLAVDGTVTDIMLTRSVFVGPGQYSSHYRLDGTDTNVEGDAIYNNTITFEEGDKFQLQMFIENNTGSTTTFDWVHPDRYLLSSAGQDNTLFRMPRPWKPLLFNYNVGGLLDVDTSGAVAGDTLEYDGAEWSAVTPAAPSPSVNGDVVYKTGGMHWMPISPKAETYFSSSVRNEFAHAIPIVDGNWQWNEYTVTGGAGVSDVIASIEFPRGGYVGDVGDLGMTIQVRLRHTGTVPIERIEVSYGKRSPEGSETGSNNQINSITSTTSEADYMASLPTNTGLLTLTEEDQLYVIVRIGADAGAWEAIISDSGNGNDILTAVPIGVYSGSKLFLGAQDVHIGGNDVRILSHDHTHIDGQYVNIGRDIAQYTYIDSQFRSEYKSGGSHRFEGSNLEFRAAGSLSERAYFHKVQRNNGISLVDVVDLTFDNYTSRPNAINVNGVYTTKVNFYNQSAGFQGDFVGTASSLYDSDTLALQTDISGLQAQINALNSNKIGDAPFDGRTYVRQNGEWVQADLGLDQLVFAFDGGRASTIYFATSVDGGQADTPVFDDGVSPLLGGLSNSTYELSPAISGDASMSSAPGTVYNIDGGLADTLLFSSTLNGGAA